MFGASFSAAAGSTSSLGYAKAGYDGVDNNGDGFIDDLAEGGTPATDLWHAGDQASYCKLGNHTHKTARSEMLYAILVEGLGPLGSVFNRDDFTDREVQDTDGDGLPEFVDAWGEPLQFYRWPIYYGTAAGLVRLADRLHPYNGFSQTRQQDPLDPNQMLVSPAWWSLGVGQPRADLSEPRPRSRPPNGEHAPAVRARRDRLHELLPQLVDPYPRHDDGDELGPERQLHPPGVLLEVPDPLGRPRQGAGRRPSSTRITDRWSTRRVVRPIRPVPDRRGHDGADRPAA